MDVPEVGIVFDDKLYRGNRASKMRHWRLRRIWHRQILPALAEIGLNIRFFPRTLTPGRSQPFTIRRPSAMKVYILKVWPGHQSGLPATLARIRYTRHPD